MDGSMLRYARRRAGMTQRALASAAGVPQPAIARIESGHVKPRLDTMSNLIAATGFTLELAPRLGVGVDRSLIRSSLERTPQDRIRVATLAAANLRSYLDAARDSRG